MKRLAALLLSLAAAAPAGARPFAARSVAVAETRYGAGGLAESFGLSFGAGPRTNGLYLAWGDEDAGPVATNWPNLVRLAPIAPEVSSYTASPPQGWGSTASFARFFLLDVAQDLPFDFATEYAEATGAQWTDTGVVPSSNTVVEVDMDYLGSLRSDAWIPVWGYRRAYNSDQLALFVANDGSQFALNCGRTDVKRDSGLALGERFVLRNDNARFYLTRVARGEAETALDGDAAYQSFAAQSGWTIALLGFRTGTGDASVENRQILARLRGVRIREDGADVRDYEPCVKDGVAGLWDWTAGAFAPSRTSTPFVPGPRTYGEGDAVESASALVSTRPIVVFSGVATNGTDALEIRWDVIGAGGPDPVAVSILYGPSADALASSNLLDSAAGPGPGAATLSGLSPGRLYFARLLVASAGGNGESETFAFSFPMPDPSAGGRGRAFSSMSVADGAAAVAFEAYPVATPLYAAWGADYGGETTNGWGHVVRVCDAAADATNAAFALPAGWGASTRFLRFFFVQDAPAGSVFLESIGATGAQHVDTGLRPDRNFTAEARVRVAAGASGYVPLWGERRTGSVDFNFVLWMPASTASSKVRPNVGNQTYDIGDQDAGRPVGQVATYSLGIPRGLLVDGEVVCAPSKFVDTDKTSSQTLILFGLRGDGAIDGRRFFGDCFGFRAFDGDDPIAVLLPCAQNGAAGLLDLLSGAFLPSATATPFVAGAELGPALVSFSELAIAPDVALPALSGIAAAGERRGDRATVSGVLASEGAGDCAIVVETSRAGDFFDAVEWPAAGTFAAGDAFSVELFDADPDSPRYIRPGATTWYRVRATDRSGAADYSPPASFSTPGAAEPGVPSVSNDGRLLSFPASLAALGANTNWAWIVYGEGGAAPGRATEKASFTADSDSLSAVFEGALDAPPGALRFALVVSNDCSTAVWVSTGAVQSATLSDNTVYTWRDAVAAGLWEDAANWDAGPGRYDWPTAGSTAVFAAGTTAEVSFASAQLDVRTVDCSADDLGLVFTGGLSHRFHPDRFDVGGRRGEVCVSNLDVVVQTGGIAPGDGRTYRVSGGATNNCYGQGYIDATGGPGRRFVLEGGSYAYTWGNVRVGGEGSAIEIEDSLLRRPGDKDGGFFFSSGAAGGTLVLRGRRPRLENSGGFRTARGGSGGRIVFVVPDGGYDEAPVVQVRNSYDNLFTPLRIAEECEPIGISIDPDSPALASQRTFDAPLVEWRAGIRLGNLSFAELPHPRSNVWLYSPSGDDPTAWTASWAAESDPCALGLRHVHKGTLVIVK